MVSFFTLCYLSRSLRVRDLQPKASVSFISTLFKSGPHSRAQYIKSTSSHFLLSVCEVLHFVLSLSRSLRPPTQNFRFFFIDSLSKSHSTVWGIGYRVLKLIRGVFQLERFKRTFQNQKMENILELVAVHGSQVETVLQDVEKTDVKQMKKKSKTQYICGSGCVLVLRYFSFVSKDF